MKFFRRTFPAAIIWLAGIVSATAHAANPVEASGFFGAVRGIVKSAQSDGTSFILTVTAVSPDRGQSTAQDDAMVGKDLVIGTRLPRDADGKPQPSKPDVAFVKTLKPGMEIVVTLFAARADPNVLRMGKPGEIDKLPATKPSSHD